MPQDFIQIQLEEQAVPEGFSTSTTPYRLATEKLYIAARSARVGPKPQHLDRSDEMRGITGAVAKLIETYEPDGAIDERCYLDDLTWLLSLAGFTGAVTVGTGGGTNEIQTITTTGVPTGGTFKLNFKGQWTTPIAFNAAAATIQAALTALRTIGAGNVVCAAGPLPAGVTCTFQGTLASQNVPAITFDDAGLTGGATPHVVVTETTPGTAGAVADPDGGTIPAAAYKWVFTKRTGILAQTAQMLANYADEAVALQGNGFGVSDMSIDSAGQVQATLMGMVLQLLGVSGTAPVLTSQAVPPIRKGNLFLSWIASGGAIDVDAFSFAIANSLARVRSGNLDPPSNFADRMEMGDDQVKVTGTIPKRVLASADYAALLAASTFSAKARWRTPKVIGATTYPYSMWLEMPSCQLVDGDADPLGNKRRFGASYSFEAAYDEAAGYDVRITVVNATPSIATYV